MENSDYQFKIRRLKRYFKKQEDILMAFVFGSYVEGRQTRESDLDIAVYFKRKFKNTIGYKDIIYKEEDRIWFDVTNIVKRKVDLVCLNRAPASLVSNVVKTGIPLVIKDAGLYWDIYLKTSLEAEDFLEFTQDYFEIYKKAKSLVPEQKIRLLERLEFLESEFKEIKEFEKLTFKQYQDNKFQRRNIERWVENIVNATIDAAKIILASEKKMMPRTYEEALCNFAVLSGFNEEESRKISKFANLRNLLAHEYLNILYKEIRVFVKVSPPVYKRVFNFLETYLKRYHK